MNGEGPQPRDAFVAIRNRAYDLADTGRYKDWSHVGYVLLVERFAPILIKRLNEDHLAVLMISRVCNERRQVRSWRTSFRSWFSMRRNKPS